MVIYGIPYSHNWLSISVLGGVMKRVNCFWFYQFSMHLRPLLTLKHPGKVRDVSIHLHIARQWLETFLSDSIVAVSLCKGKGRDIITAIDKVINTGWDNDIDWIDLHRIKEGVNDFEVLLNAELSNLDVYAVSSKGIYSIPQLIDHADHAFDEDVLAILSENAIHDIRQAGRCLAFDLPTASGFHIARAVESVLIGYLGELCPDAVTTLKSAQRNLGRYIELAKENNGEEKICAVLDQFRKLDRNPLIHPDTVLTMGQAIILFGTSQSVILSLATEMQKPRKGA